MNEKEVTMAIVQAIQQSQTQLTLYDMVIILGVIIVSLSVLLYVLWRMGIIGKTTGNSDIIQSLENVTEQLHQTTVNSKLANEAHSAILTKNQDGIPVILTIPEELRKVTKVLERLAKVLDKMTNL